MKHLFSFYHVVKEQTKHTGKQRDPLRGSRVSCFCHSFAEVLRTQCPRIPKIHVEILFPNVIVLGGAAFGRGLGHEGAALVNGVTELAPLSHPEDTGGVVSVQPEEGSPPEAHRAGALVSDCLPTDL